MRRYDVWFGEFYVNDLENGTLRKESAQQLVKNFWKLVFDEGYNFILSARYDIPVHIMPYHNTARDKWLQYKLEGLPSMKEGAISASWNILRTMALKRHW
jgi:hypothetical protein